MGRPQLSGPSIVVAIDTELLVWTDGVLSGDKTLTSTCKLASLVGLEVPIYADGPVEVADLSVKAQPINVVAALFAANPGRARILEAPESVWAYFPVNPEDILTPVDVEVEAPPTAGELVDAMLREGKGD